MKHTSHRPSATSLPPSPHDDARARETRYLVMMGVRIVCFVLMVVITPYGWYTWVFGLAAIFLPYIAVVMANVSKDVGSARPENPELALPPKPSEASKAGESTVFKVEEKRPIESGDVDEGAHPREDEPE